MTGLGFALIPIATERVVKEVIGAAIQVHRTLGPGFLERIYAEALCLELHARDLSFERERPIVVTYRGVDIPGQRVDLIVAGCVIVELKAISKFDPIHEAKVISYLKTTGIRVGLLLNFHAPTLRAGLKRLVL